MTDALGNVHSVRLDFAKIAGSEILRNIEGEQSRWQALAEAQRGMLALLPGDAQYFFTRPNVPRGLDAYELQQLAAELGLRGEVIPSVAEAFARAKAVAGPDDLIYVGGSSFVVAEVLSVESE